MIWRGRGRTGEGFGGEEGNFPGFVSHRGEGGGGELEVLEVRNQPKERMSFLLQTLVEKEGRSRGMASRPPALASRSVNKQKAQRVFFFFLLCCLCLCLSRYRILLLLLLFLVIFAQVFFR